MSANMIRISKGVGAALLLAALAACGSGLDSTNGTSSSGGSGGSGGGGNNNTPPGIPNNILFVTPATGNTIIALQGTGGKTNAEVTFEVDDASNTGVAGIPVTFSLISNTGDASLTTTTGTTDTSGRASTFVVSGNVHYSVAVQATISTASGIKTAKSNALTITTGIPTEGNFGMAVSNLTASNAYNILGITDTVTVQLSDRFHNPAPDGTAVTFFANQGQMQGECFTSNGSCSAIWTSSALQGVQNTPFVGGQVEILAYTAGEESFTDVDGDGVFDNNDVFTTGGTDQYSVPVDPTSDDIGEIYLDGAETGAFVSNDFYFDFNKNGARGGPDGKFYGFGCVGTATVHCGSKSSIGIGKQICVNLSTNTANITTNPVAVSTLAVTAAAGAPVNVTFTVSDLNGHSLGAGTKVSLIQSNVVNATITTPPNLPFTYSDNSCGNNSVSFTVSVAYTGTGTAPLPASGIIELEVDTQGTGAQTTFSQPITLQ